MSNKMDPSKIGKEDVSIDVDKLAKSLEGNIDTLIPLSENCCIYRVPQKIRMLNETLYTPKIVSIGPLHHGREELKAMEEHKLRYLEKFLKRTSVPMKEFLTLIKGKETELRNCYAETINFGHEDFVKMVFLDSVFLIEIFLRNNSKGCPEPDRIFTKPGMIMDIVLDIMLLENQLPIFILVDLFAKLDFPRNSLSQLAKFFFKKYICQDVSIDESLIESYFFKAEHFVDLLRLCLAPSKRDGTERPAASRVVPNASGVASGVVTNASGDVPNASRVVPNVTKLYQAGVKFEEAPPNTNLLDISFDKSKGSMKIPKLTIGNMTEQLLRNLQIFERLHTATNYMNDYVVILNRLLNTSKDVELLIHIRVIDNRILDSGGVSTLFQQLSKNARVKNTNFHYLGLVKDLQSYCKSPCHEWKANLMQNYFNTPWASISVIAGCILLILTFIQTVYSVKKP